MPPIRTEDVQAIEAKTILTPASGYVTGFTHTLNPYQGCAFGDGGCGVYCYVAESPIGLHAEKPWGQWLKAKTNAATALVRDLSRLDAATTRVFMSSSTDPYQPAESHFRVTRSVLETFADHPIGLLVIQTRSPLVERDLDVIARLPFAWISMSIETDDDAIRRELTPTCPSIERRFEALRKAREAGVPVQVAVSPMLPSNVGRFADMIAETADRVVVDTFYGDGAGGRRTSRRPIASRLRALGYDWRDTTQAEELRDALAARLGRERVGWLQEGFNSEYVAVSKGARVSN